ncbi:MAG TPA: 3-dehydroquinate synthase [Thermoanaerobaculia bacterium]
MTPFLTIQQSTSYPVYVEHGLIDRIGELVRTRGRVFVITSTALRDRFGERVAASFPKAAILTIEEGETHKTIATAYDVVTQLLEHGAKRDSLAIVVGGGMIGDTAGFAASIFLRGIDLVHVPTTLLAQVDSSLGGKLAVNHEKGKNLIGSFYPPVAVIADLDVLATLPPRERLSGLYEALKGGVIADESLFALFEQGGTLDIDEIVRKAIRVKAEIVSADEREADLRRLLNYGHTIAHGIEAALHYEGLTHGEAVAWGMIAANAIAVRRGLLAKDEASRIERTILALEPSALPPLDPNDIFAATEHDKKNTGSARVMVFPKRVGECVVVSDVTEEEVRFGIQAVVRG